VSLENAGGFNLREVIPANGFLDPAAQRGIGKGTYALLLIFESSDSAPSLRLDRWAMKEHRVVTEETVQCPVSGCDFVAPRMTRDGPNLDAADSEKLAPFLCPHHHIYISPSTFEYADARASILWHDPESLAALDSVLASGEKRDGWRRMGRERDEDSLTWNVFWHLYREQRLADSAAALIDLPSSPQGVEGLVLWSVELPSGFGYKPLKEARTALGETPTSGTEPDVILTGPQGSAQSVPIAIIESKLGSPLVTSTKGFPDRYSKHRLWNHVFTQDPSHVYDVLGYQLIRLLLLAQTFHEQLQVAVPPVVAITQDKLDSDQIAAMRQCLRRLPWGPERLNFITWRQVRDWIGLGSASARFLSRYLAGKTMGYSGDGTLKLLLD